MVKTAQVAHTYLAHIDPHSLGDKPPRDVSNVLFCADLVLVKALRIQFILIHDIFSTHILKKVIKILPKIEISIQFFARPNLIDSDISLYHLREFSRIIRESPVYRPNLPLSDLSYESSHG